MHLHSIQSNQSKDFQLTTCTQDSRKANHTFAELQPMLCCAKMSAPRIQCVEVKYENSASVLVV